MQPAAALNAAQRGILANIDQSLAALDAHSPLKSYDIWILTASTQAEVIAQERRARTLLGCGGDGHERVILSVLEAWPGGAGNLLGTLHAFEQAAARYRALYGGDLYALFASGERKIVMVHNGGLGKRCSPLVQSEGNSRGSLFLPGILGRGVAAPQARLLTAVLAQIIPFAQSNRGGELDVFWSSQVFFGSRPLATAPPSDFLFTKISQPLAPERRLTDQDLHDLGIFEAGAGGEILDFKAQNTFQSQGEYGAWRGQVGGAALDIGSFRIKYRLFQALNAYFQPQLQGKTGKLDLDPHFTQPLIVALAGLRRASRSHLPEDAKGWMAHLDESTRARLQQFPTHLSVLTCMTQAFAGESYEGFVGLFSVGEAIEWWRYRRSSELYDDAMALLQGDFRARALRRFRGIRHPIEGSLIGSTFIEGPEITFDAMAEGVEIDGIWLKNTVIRRSQILAGSALESSLVCESSGQFRGQTAYIMHTTVASAEVEGAYCYRLATDRTQKLGPGQVLAGYWREEGPGVMQSTLRGDAKANDKRLLAGNPLSFHGLRALPVPENWAESMAQSHQSLRDKLGLMPFARSQSPECLWPLVEAAVASVSEGGKEGWPEGRIEIPHLSAKTAKAVARAAAWRFLSLYRQWGRQVLPDLGMAGQGGQNGTDPSPPRPHQLAAERALDILTAVAMHGDDSVAGAAIFPFFGQLMEGINDALLRSGRDISGRVMMRVWQKARAYARGAEFDARLRHYGLENEVDLARYHHRVREGAFIDGPEAPEAVRRVVILPRVTLGAEIAIGSVLLARVHRHYPQAEIHYFADPKVDGLFDGLPRLKMEPFKFQRRGGLAARLNAWVHLSQRVEALAPERVFGPDSRADQLGSLPVIGEISRYFFWENSIAAPAEAQSMARLLKAALDRELGPDGEAALPRLFFRKSLQDASLAFWQRIAGPKSRRLSVKFDVGGAEEKRLGLDFEIRLLKRCLMGSRSIVLLDRGFSEAELSRAENYRRAAEELGVEILEITDLAGGLGVALAQATPQRGDGSLFILFHGTIRGWAALSAHCPRAISYDSVHQHLAAAEKLPLSPGSEVIVPFTGFPVPWFPKLWAPTGRLEAHILIPPRDFMGPGERDALEMACISEIGAILDGEASARSAAGSNPAAQNLEGAPETWAMALAAALPDFRPYSLLRFLLKQGRILVKKGAVDGLLVVDGTLHFTLQNPNAHALVLAFLERFLPLKGDDFERLTLENLTTRALKTGGNPPQTAKKASWMALLNAAADYRALDDIDGQKWGDFRRQFDALDEENLPVLSHLQQVVAYYRLAVERAPLGSRTRARRAIEGLQKLQSRGKIPPNTLQNHGFWAEDIWIPPLEFHPERHFKRLQAVEDGQALAERVARALATAFHRQKRPVIAGWVGAGGSGKTTLCRGICEALQKMGLRALNLGADAYVWPGHGFRYEQDGQGRRTHFWGPGIYDNRRLVEVLRAIRRGEKVHLPEDKHGGYAGGLRQAPDILLVDGVFLGLDAQVYGLLDWLWGIWFEGEGRFRLKAKRDGGPSSSRRIDIPVDYLEKVFHESGDGIRPILYHRAHGFWHREKGQFFERGRPILT